jgi:DNA replication protein DnaC
MLTKATVSKLCELGLQTMADALVDQLEHPGTVAELSFEDRLGLLIDKEADARDSRRQKMRLRTAKLRYPAAIEDLDWRRERGIDKGLLVGLSSGSFVRRHLNVVLTGPTGVGKTFIACALANGAIRSGHSAYYVRAPRLADDLAIGRSDGRYGKILAHLAKIELVVIDDFLLTPAPTEVCRDLLEVVEDRSERRSTIVVSQLPIEHWHQAMADPTLSEAILDRLLQSSHRIALTGPSLRRRDPDSSPEGAA